MLGFDWKPRRPKDAELVFAWQPKAGGINVGDHLAGVIAAEMLKHRDRQIGDKRDRGAKLLTVGSVLHFARDGDCVWGAGVNGKIRPEQHRFKALDVRAVRGPLTQRFLEERGIACPGVFGDPALLMPLFFNADILGAGRIRHDFVVVPHLHDDPRLYERYGDRVVSPSWHPARFAAALVGAQRVVSSSLHGIVIAESYGVPAVRLDNGGTEPAFKYEDYCAGTDREHLATGRSVEECLRLAPSEPLPIERIQRRLFRSFPYDLWEAASNSRSCSQRP